MSVTAVMPTEERLSFVREHNLGSAFRDGLHISFAHVGAIVAPYLAISVPFSMLQTYGQINGMLPVFMGAFALNLFAGLIAYGALVVSVSDACLGNMPSLSRSLRKMWSRAGTLAAASFLQVLAIALGLLLLVIPGLIVMMWLLFTPAVVVLEGKGPVEAMRRSKQLAQGFGARHFALFILVTLAGGGLGAVIGFIAGAAGLEPGTMAFMFVTQVPMAMMQAVMIVILVLFYYDLRVRKESYSAELLAENLAN